MSTRTVSVREARRTLPDLLDHVQAGEEVVVLRRGVEVARLVPPRPKMAALPDLRSLRARLKVRGAALSREISEARRSARY